MVAVTSGRGGFDSLFEQYSAAVIRVTFDALKVGSGEGFVVEESEVTSGCFESTCLSGPLLDGSDDGLLVR